MLGDSAVRTAPSLLLLSGLLPSFVFAFAACSGSSSSAGHGGGADGGTYGLIEASTDGAGNYDGPVADSACPALPAAGAWINVSPPGSNYTTTYTGMNAVVVRPDDPAIVYAGADSNGIFRSTDCGATWALVNTGAHAAEMSSGRPWSMVIDPVTPDVMYVVQGYGASGLWKSTNAGVDWNQVLSSDVTAAFYSGGQITSISLDPTDHTHLVVESHGDCASGKLCAAESTDSGASWKVIDMSSIGDWAESSAVQIVDQTHWLYCGLFSGLYRTADEGATWQTVDVSGALPSCDYYEPHLWQGADGRYYLPAIAYAGPGLLQSAPNDATSWSVVAGSPQADVLVATSTQVIVAKSQDSTYWAAPQSNPTTYASIPGPVVGTTGDGGELGGGAEFLTYDPVHHVLYSSTFSTGLWQTVIE